MAHPGGAGSRAAVGRGSHGRLRGCRFAPPGTSHVTDRDCLDQRRPGILQDSRPQPRRWSSLCPWAVLRLVLHLLLLLLTPRHHSRTSAVVTGRCEGSRDAQLLVSPPRALASLPASSHMSFETSAYHVVRSTSWRRGQLTGWPAAHHCWHPSCL